ncbi:ArsR/SmtB family transcription factor [Natronosalvus halobius]|uniref:ArsR/SmtB family transcription factor n=1 Tax=Natronosalvus halobius TaxID=2953746 RepID=UPI00209D1925|nr:helix-turn-helix domain-containing protein [Natronosalvus halobius]USZ71214.1 helix-turn-helix domain-containing protein [Natronosalvus halobius]
MARLFPLRSETPAQEGQPRVVDLEDEDADAVFGALSSTTARRIYSHLNDEPGTPSDVADAIDSSIQNVRYHLEKLEDAGLVEVVDTWYSSRGNEMSVYATADGPLIVTSDRSTAERLKTALSRFIGGVAALAGGSLLVQYGLSRYVGPQAGTEGTAGTGGTTDGGAAGNGNGNENGDGAGDEAGNGNGASDESGNGNGAATDDSTDSTDAPETEDSETAEEDTADGDGADGTDSGDGGDGGDDGDMSTTDVDESDEAPEAEDDVSSDDTSSDSDGNDSATEDDAADADGANYSDNSTDGDVATDGGNESVAPSGDGNGSVDGVTDGAAEAADAIFATIPPGALFFLGGLVVLIAVTVYWYWATAY